MRVLFVTSTRVGDAILSTGLLAHLLERHPDGRITVACGPAAADLFAAVPGIERVIVLDKMLLSLHWLRLWTLAAGRVWDLVVDLRNAPVTYLLARRRRVGLPRGGRGQRRIELIGESLDLSPPPAPRIWTAEAHETRATALVPAGGPVIAVGPTANWRAKTWPAERYAALVERLTAPDGILPDARVAIFGRDDERPQALHLIECIRAARRLDLVGRLDLLTVYACIKRCDLYIGNDSGLMHLAAASGIPTLGLFGPTQESLYAPWGKNARVVRTAVPFAEIFPPGFDHRNAGTLMESLTVDMAAEAAENLWRETAGARGVTA